MQVLAARDGVFTNFEVRELLNQQQHERDEAERAMPLPGARRGQSVSTAWSAHQQGATISEQVLTHLNKTTQAAGQSRENIQEFMEAVKPFKLTRMECLAIVNTPPLSVVEVHLLVEDCEERLQPDDVRSLINLCSKLVNMDRASAVDDAFSPVSCLGAGMACASGGTPFSGSGASAPISPDPHSPTKDRRTPMDVASIEKDAHHLSPDKK